MCGKGYAVKLSYLSRIVFRPVKRRGMRISFQAENAIFAKTLTCIFNIKDHSVFLLRMSKKRA